MNEDSGYDVPAGGVPAAGQGQQAEPFADLLAANRLYASRHPHAGFDGVARAGVALVTCMDSRIEPLAMVGLDLGDAKILRNPGGRVTPQTLVALVLGVTLLGVKRILVVEHTRCAMASASEHELQRRVGAAAGADAGWLHLGVITDQPAAIRDDVAMVRAHPLVPGSVTVGGFLYDVDSGRLEVVSDLQA